MKGAEDLYYGALEYDSLFARAYAGLAQVYWEKHIWSQYFSGNFMDSVLILANIALSLDNQLAEAYIVRGDYYGTKGMLEQALEEYDKAIRFNPNDWLGYYGKGYYYWQGNFEKTIELGIKVNLTDPTDPEILNLLGQSFMFLDQNEESLKYLKKYIEKLKDLGIITINNMHRIGYAYWQNGFKNEADYYFNEQINYCNRMNEMGREWGSQLMTYYDLAGIYAFKAEKAKEMDGRAGLIVI